MKVTIIPLTEKNSFLKDGLVISSNEMSFICWGQYIQQAG